MSNSGISIAEGRAVCLDPSRDNCAVHTFVTSPDQEPAFKTFMEDKLKEFEDTYDGEVMDGLITERCQYTYDKKYVGKYVACCPDSYRDDYEYAMFDQNGSPDRKSVG